MIIKILLFLCLIVGSSFSQNLELEKTYLSIGFGIGNTHLIDEYISKNEYTGISNKYNLYWSVHDSSRSMGVDFSFGKINNLQNINNSATTYDFRLGYRYLYNIYSGTVFSNPLFLYIGPEFNIYMHYRDQKVAESSKALSIASAISSDAALNAVYYLLDNLSLSYSFTLSVLSFTAQTPSLKDANNLPSPIDLLTILSIQNINSSIFVVYKITDPINIKIGYNFRFVQISKWDRFRLINDNIILQLGLDF